MITQLHESSYQTMFQRKSDIIVPVHKTVCPTLMKLAGTAKKKENSLFEIETVKGEGIMLDGVFHFKDNSEYEMWEPKDDNSGHQKTKYSAVPECGLKMVDKVNSGNEFVNCKVLTMGNLGKKKAEVLRLTAKQLDHEAGIQHVGRSAPLVTINPRGIGDAVIMTNS